MNSNLPKITFFKSIIITITLSCLVFSCTRKTAVQTAPASTVWHESSYTSTPGSVKVRVIARKKDCIFKGKKAHYRFNITNNYTTPQEGTLSYEIITDRNKKLYGYIYDIHVDPESSINIRANIDIKTPGFYDIIVKVNLTDYDDTIKSVFGFKPMLINTPIHKPDDFEKFWQDTRNELNAIAPNFSMEYNKELSTPTHKLFNVTFQSLDNITIHSWLSVPRLPGSYPVMVAIPGYKQRVKPFFAEDQAVFCILVRTTADLIKAGKNLNEEKEFCVFNIGDKKDFIYRGAIMDCLRSMDFIFSHTEVGLDSNRVFLSGGSQGGALSLITASFDHRISICETENPIFCDFHNYYGITSAKTPNEFPYKYFNQTKIPWNKLFKTLAYFDVQNFVPNIECPCMFAIGTRDPIAPPTCIYAAYNKLNAKTKKISEINVLDIGHETTKEYLSLKNLWIDENIVAVRH